MSKHKSVDTSSNEQTLTGFYSDDHNRLDSLWKSAIKLKEIDLKEAAQILQKFKEGLEQHMAWEEAILFSEYDLRIPSANNENPTIDLCVEHEQLRTYLEATLKKWRENNPNTEKDETRFTELLTAHNEAEENGVYPRVDEILSNSDRSEIFQRMRDSALT